MFLKFLPGSNIFVRATIKKCLAKFFCRSYLTVFWVVAVDLVVAVDFVVAVVLIVFGVVLVVAVTKVGTAKIS